LVSPHHREPALRHYLSPCIFLPASSTLRLAILTEAEVIKAIRRADEIAVKVANSA
jgi:hypothetical protein